MPGKKAEDPCAPLWVLSFSDMMSLLLTFFVLLATFSTFDEGKLSQICGALKGAFGMMGANKKSLLDPQSPRYLPDSQEEEVPVSAKNVANRYERFRKALAAMNEELQKLGLYEMVRIEVLQECISMKMLNPVIFYPGEARIKPEGKRVLALIAEILLLAPNDIRIIGFSDPAYAKPGEDAAWRLATARAGAVATFLAKKGKVQPGRIAISGWGAGLPEQVGESRTLVTDVGAEVLLLSRPPDRRPSAQEVIVTDDWE